MRNKNFRVTSFFAIVSLVLLQISPIFAGTLSAAPLLSKTTASLPLATAQANGSNAPVLLIYNDSYASNVFGHYLGEIMKAEGFNLFDEAQLSTISAATLANYDSVILAETSLNNAQTTLLSNYVSQGGNLIAMRPDAQLATVFGLGSAAGTLANGYMSIQTNTGYGSGFTGESIQLHTPANQYTSNTGQVVALLYSNATTTTSYPAVIVNSYGSGKAVAFTYDLASSVIYLRQGNPAQADIDADNDGLYRFTDLFYNWIDLNKMSIPQADVHQRLFGRLLSQLNLSKKPLPRFWYFPNAKNTTAILTSDAHANPDSYYSNLIASMNRFNATTTFYMSQAGNPSLANVNSWKAQGYIFSIHPYMVSNPLSVGYDNVDSWFNGAYGTRTSRTVRIHNVQWQGWVDAAKIGVAHNMAMDYTPYLVGQWFKSSPGWSVGYMTGSGMPMKFIDQSGQIINNFSQYTEVTDDQIEGPEGLTDNGAFHVTQQAIDASEAGDNQPIAFQMHVDNYAGEQAWAENTLSYLNSLNIPIYNGDQWLGFTENRYNSTFSNFGWTNNQLSFTASVPATQTGQTLQLPLQSANGNLSAITVNGSTASYSTRAVRGENFAFLTLSGGNSTVNVTYTPDVTAPVLSGISVIPYTTQAQINWNTDVAATTLVKYGTTTALGTNSTVFGLSASHAVTLTGLSPATSYYYQIVSADQFGNQASSSITSFTTPANQIVQNTYALFGGGTFTSTAATRYSTGEVKLLSTLEDTFPGTTLDTTKWFSSSTASGGNISVNNGITTVSGSYLQSVGGVDITGKTMSARLKFTPGVVGQEWGVSPDLSSSWLLFGIPYFDANHLYARTKAGSVLIDEKLDWLDISKPHVYQIKYNNGVVTYYIDGIVATTHNATFTGSAPVWVYTGNTSGTMTVNWVRYDSYPSSGSFVSTPLDAGTAVKWSALAWNGAANGGGVQLAFRTSGDGVNWTAWSSPNANSYQTLSGIFGRYLQYSLSLTTPNSAISPQVSAVTAMYNPVTVDHVVVTPVSATVITGNSLSFSAAAYDVSNNLLPGVTFSWAVVNGGGTIDSTGVFTATTIGTFNNTVAATSSGKTGYSSVTVSSAAPPPVISGVTVSTINNTATISWTTDKPSTSQVQYGTTTSYGSSTTLDNTLVTSHSQTITGLSFNTIYNFRVLSRDASGSLSTSSNFTFSMPSAVQLNAGGGAAAPYSADTNVSGGNAGGTVSASIDTTGVTNPAPQAVYQTERWGVFTYTIPNLTANGVYLVRLHFAETWFTSSGQRKFNVIINGQQVLTNFDIFATVGAQNKAIVKEFSVNANASGQIVIQYTQGTADYPKASGIQVIAASPNGTPPVVSGVTASPLSNSATLSWTTDKASTSQVQYGTTTSYGSSTTLDGNLVTGHSQTLSGLSAGTTYNYRVISRDAAGNTTTSGNFTFTTTGTMDTTPPTISITAPANSATVSNTVTISASASDNVAVSSVQFLLDGAPLGSPVTTAPYTLNWDTISLSNGSHTLGAQATDPSGNVGNAAAVSVTVANPVAVRINAGGGAAAPYSADTNVSGGNAGGTVSASIDTTGVTNPAPQAVYQSERWGVFTYTIPNLTANGTYLVRLHFAETWFTSSGQRKFNVIINGQQVLTNFDIFATVGAQNKAIVREFNVTANASGQIVIQYTQGTADYPKASGIEVIQSS